jgi:hypothetical protein
MISILTVEQTVPGVARASLLELTLLIRARPIRWTVKDSDRACVIGENEIPVGARSSRRRIRENESKPVATPRQFIFIILHVELQPEADLMEIAQASRTGRFFPLLKAGGDRPAGTVMIAITTSSSIKVKARRASIAGCGRSEARTAAGKGAGVGDLPALFPTEAATGDRRRVGLDAM